MVRYFCIADRSLKIIAEEQIQIKLIFKFIFCVKLFSK